MGDPYCDFLLRITLAVFYGMGEGFVSGNIFHFITVVPAFNVVTV